MDDKKNTIFIALYNAFPMTSGASTVTTSLFKCWPTRKKFLFQITHENPKNEQNIFSYKIISNNRFVKLFTLPFYLLFIFRKILKKRNNIKFFVIEGASWVGYIYVFQLILKIFFKNSKFIYHSHNVESDIRKNKFLVSSLTYYFENKVMKNFDFVTAVSEKDQSIFLKKFKQVTYLLENGVFIDKKILKQKHKIKNFIVFPGSLEFSENKKTFDNLYKKIFPFLKKKINKKLSIILTGSGIKFFKNNNDINEVGVLKKTIFLNYLISSWPLIIPSKKGPGTKIKIIEALCYNKIVFATKDAFNGIDTQYQNEIIYLNNDELFKKLIAYKKNPKKLSKKYRILGKYYRNKFDMNIISKKFYETIKNR